MAGGRASPIALIWRKEKRWRVRTLGSPARDTHRPQWRGSEDIAGKTVLLHTEQGFGDAIQFVRYAPLVATRGAKVVLACPEKLRALFEAAPGVTSVFVPERQSAPAFDFHAPLMNLPLALGTTLEDLPSRVPNLRASAEKAALWRQGLAGQGTRVKIGIAWSGNPRFGAARLKACLADLLQALLDVPRCAFVSLQTGDAGAEATRLSGGKARLVDAGRWLAEFDDTAAVIASLDLVISIDTAVAHLAGSLARPVRKMLPVAADWRWRTQREGSPWYPTARLYRQQQPGDRERVVKRIASDLAEEARTRAARVAEAMQPGRLGQAR